MSSRDEEFQQLISAHAAAVARVAGSYCKQAAEREDLQQDIWFAVWRALPNFRAQASYKTFIMRIAHNRAMSAIAKRSKHSGFDDADVELTTVASPESLASQNQQAEALLAAVRRLPLNLRQVLTLRLEGLSLAEVANVLGISENNATVRANRARAKLRQWLPGNDGHE